MFGAGEPGVVELPVLLAFQLQYKRLYVVIVWSKALSARRRQISSRNITCYKYKNVPQE